nr:MAG TPA: hypothetical protein [Caudoviricetes sp.]
MSARKLNQLFSTLTVLRARDVPHYLVNACNYVSGAGIGTEASTCRNDGTTDSISEIG